MLVIRLQRTGRKNKATFRVVLQEHSQAPKAAAQEILGSYNPHAAQRADQITLNTERIQHWLSKGAQPSPTVHNMLIERGIIEGKKKRSVKPKKGETPEAEAGAEPAEAKTEEAPA